MFGGLLRDNHFFELHHYLLILKKLEKHYGKIKREDLKKGLIILLITILICLFVLEITSRLMVSNELDIPLFFNTKEAIYPKLHTEFENYTENSTNILFLGGSVLDYSSGQIEEMVENNSSKSYKIYDVSRKAHTTLDSYYKYRYLVSKGYDFDYIVFYHGINEVRANNIPEEFFEKNYEHYSFYRLVNQVFRPDNLFLDVFLDTSLGYRYYELYASKNFKDVTIPQHSPRKKWMNYGENIKTKRTFRKNLLRIIPQYSLIVTQEP